MADEEQGQDSEKPLLEIIQQIKEGLIPLRAIAKDLRQEIVEFLYFQAQEVSSIAQFLKVSDKTVRRDVADIRKKNSLSPNQKLVGMTVGEMLAINRQNINHLMRLARSKEGSVGEKAQAEYLAHRANMERIQRLQSLGYLPNQPQAVIGSFYHNISKEEALKKFEEINAEVLEVEQVFKDCKIDDPQANKGLEDIKKALEKDLGQKKDEGEDGKCQS